MDSPDLFSESPMEPDEAAYPCKGCGEILEEGKAFELAGSRWHIDCFRCNTCGLLLDSDAILLLLGDGSLICNNCTYSCNACGNKIEDLAILTGEQAFCASCFRCRNCKQKIDNLKYARTSQGIFCMACHETLMARRRKKSSRTANSSSHKPGSSAQSPMLLDKSLPSLPSNVLPQAVFSPDIPLLPPNAYTEPSTELSPRPRIADARKDSARSRKRDRSPPRHEEAKKSESRSRPTHTASDDLVLPSTTYSSPGPSGMAAEAAADGPGVQERGGSFDIPLVLDTSDLQTTLAMDRRGIDRRGSESRESPTTQRQAATPARSPLHLANANQSKSPPMSFDGASGTPALVKAPVSAVSRPRSGKIASSDSVEGRRPDERKIREKPETAHHSASPDTPDRILIDDSRVQHARSSSPTREETSTSGPGSKFQLQEVPKSRKAGHVSRGSKSENLSPVDATVPVSTGLSRSLSGSIGPALPNPLPDRIDSVRLTDPPKALRPGWAGDSDRASGVAKKPDQLPGPSRANGPQSSVGPLPHRKDSLRNQSTTKQTIPRRDLPDQRGRSSSHSPQEHPHPRAISGPSASTTIDEANPHLPTNGSGPSHGDVPSSKGSDSPTSAAIVDPVPQPRSRTHPAPTPALALAPSAAPESFTTPRPPPQPQVPHPRSPNHSISTLQTESSRGGGGDTEMTHSPGLPQYDQTGEFNMEEDMARILGGNDDSSAAILHRVSSAVRHGRSFSDMETRSRASGGKWPRSPLKSTLHSPYPQDLHSPSSVSPESKEETMALKNELRRSAQKIADLEARVHSSADIQSLDSKLREKRSTVAFLDSQKEIMVRELEVLTEHVAEAKDHHRPLDLEGLTSTVVREFALSLERLKDTYGPEVEALIRKKHELMEENTRLARARDQAIEETEQLNLKNAQLADLNNELTNQIQGRYEANRDQAAATAAATFDLPARPTANGLGIYTTAKRERSETFLDTRDYRPSTGYGGSTSSSIQGLLNEPNEAESGTMLASPHVVNIRKGQVKKFNWKKGGQQVAKGVSKGLKGAFSTNPPPAHGGSQQLHHHVHLGGGPVEGMPYASMMPLDSPGSGMNGGPRPLGHADQGRGFFGQRLGKGMPGKMASNGHLLNPAAEGPSTLFGSDLIERADYEHRQIPSVVTRCIEQVELRGMDVEGIYRKTGGTSLVKIIQDGFDRQEDYDISDANLDITAVTSVLKQYLRRLPIPLLTFDVYDAILEANACTEDEQKAAAMRAALQTLPATHRDCLEFLVFHLARVALREKENKMTPRNLAVVFAPTIMRDHSLEREMFDMHAKNAAIQFLIEHNKTIFAGSAVAQGPVL